MALPYPETVRAKTPSAENLYAKVRHAIPAIEWPVHAQDIDAIMTLKRTRNAVVLAHNYQTPEIFHCVADFVGDSLALAREAMTADADVIVLAGVHFMAETAKLFNPEKTVLIPDLGAGCSLAESIRPEDVRLLRQTYPGVPIVTYVNTSAAVKALSDICCTSGNARAVIESLGVERVIMLPDEFLARNVAAETNVKVVAWSGHCEVHERFNAAEVRQLREDYPGRDRFGASGMPAGRCGGSRFFRLDSRDVVLCEQEPSRPRGAFDRMLDERQCRNPISRARIHPAVQSLPAYEKDHASQYQAGAGDDATRSAYSS